MTRRGMGRGWLLGLVLATAGVVPGTAGAQQVQFLTPEIGDRRVILRWNKAPGDTFEARERARCKQSCGECCEVPAFGGYQIWRGSSADTSKLVLVRTYSVFDTTWTFVGDNRVFSDPDSVIIRGCGGTPGLDPDFCDPLTGRAVAPFNGFQYWYAISWFESRAETVGVSARIREITRQSRGEGLRQASIMPAAPATTVAPVLGDVRVVPNPYDPSDPANRLTFRGEERIQFINLPSPARVKIYTISGDLIRELENTDTDGAIDWNLRNADGRNVVPGIYMFVAETGDGRQRRNGHFVIIR
jgi:hypothetical protein